ncbi:hypothetical protein SKAU_G00202510 [Synaphobranchus kaupii]|uniref:Uncharacterized protein n=1 Tax=Synaphobranchus kaupii TaxID=118154 RepID=A0A9Q1IW88_SYNKA|nr:hypothetical protein SKAU_G00202510 [Synaphobranchus kaupii]
MLGNYVPRTGHTTNLDRSPGEAASVDQSEARSSHPVGGSVSPSFLFCLSHLFISKGGCTPKGLHAGQYAWAGEDCFCPQTSFLTRCCFFNIIL